MRMDRYEDIKEDEFMKTRTKKNQELYTDVYMNNVYLDIDNLKSVMNDDDNSSKESDNLKIVRENKVIDYTYEDKIYDINILIDEAIKNKKDDNIKRSLDTKVDDLEIENLIETIQENKIKENDQELLSDLVTGNDNTVVVSPLTEEVTDNNLEKIEKEDDEEIEKN